MIDKYFFVPASNLKFISNVSKIIADYIVFDLEDAIGKSELNSSINNLSTLKVQENFWVRFPFIDSEQSDINGLLEIGFKNFIVPKIKDEIDFSKVLTRLNKLEDYNLIILVENPQLLINLTNFIGTVNHILKGIGLGSHDYASEINMQHDFENLYFARNLILNTAKANKINAIDIASMEINDETKLKREFISTVRMGFDAKFFIHPKQLEVFDRTKFFTDEEITEAFEVKTILNDETDYAAFKHRGKVYEKPHLKRLQRIIEWAEKYERI